MKTNFLGFFNHISSPSNYNILFYNWIVSPEICWSGRTWWATRRWRPADRCLEAYNIAIEHTKSQSINNQAFLLNVYSSSSHEEQNRNARVGQVPMDERVEQQVDGEQRQLDDQHQGVPELGQSHSYDRPPSSVQLSCTRAAVELDQARPPPRRLFFFYCLAVKLAAVPIATPVRLAIRVFVQWTSNNAQL